MKFLYAILLFLSANAVATQNPFKYLGQGVMLAKTKQIIRAACVGGSDGTSNERSCHQIQFLEFDKDANYTNLGVKMSRAEFEQIVNDAKQHECFVSEDLEEHEAAALKERVRRKWQFKPVRVAENEYKNLVDLIQEHAKKKK